MGLTASDKQFISGLVLGESARLESKLTADLTTSLTASLTASLKTIIFSESSRLETIMEDDRQVLNTCLDMLNGNLVAVGTVNEHGERIYTIERTQRSLVTTVGQQAKVLKKMTTSGAQ